MNELDDLMEFFVKENGPTSKTKFHTGKSRQEIKDEIERIKEGLKSVTVKPLKVSIVEKEDRPFSFKIDNGIDRVNREYDYFTIFDKKTLKEWFEEEYATITSELNISRYSKLSSNVVYNYLFNGSPDNFAKYLNSLSFALYVAPWPPEVKQFLFRYEKVSKRRVNHIIQDGLPQKIMEVYSDGLTNLIPLVANFNKTPQELKQKFPTANWKKLANNSFSKNLKIVNFIDCNATYFLNHYFEDLIILTELPSTLLKYKEKNILSLKYASLHLKGQWSNKTVIDQITNLFRDTLIIIQRFKEKGIELNFNPLKWSPRRLKEEHDRLAKELAHFGSSPIPYKCLDRIPIKTFEIEGSPYTATLLMSEREIAEEGTRMGHCVGVYGSSVARGEYLVYSVKDADGQHYSTIGITTRSIAYMLSSHLNPSENVTKLKFTYNLNQHYKRFNTVVDDENAIKLGKELVIALNNKETKLMENSVVNKRL